MDGVPAKGGELGSSGSPGPLLVEACSAAALPTAVSMIGPTGSTGPAGATVSAGTGASSASARSGGDAVLTTALIIRLDRVWYSGRLMRRAIRLASMEAAIRLSTMERPSIISITMMKEVRGAWVAAAR